MALLIVLLTASGCWPKTHSGSQAFSGIVIDQENNPIANARVEVNGRETQSKSDGAFQLAVPAADRYVLNFSHLDFAEFSYISRVSVTGQRWPLVRAQVETVDPTKAIMLQDKRPELTKKKIGGATFALAADSLVDDHGNAPAGAVRAAIATLDVSNGEGPGDWAVRSDAGKDEGFLVSYGAFFVQFTDATGKVRYQLRSGKTGQVSLPVIPSMSAHAPGTPQADLWYYRLKEGDWRRTGKAVFDAASGAYAGSVDHLSTINTDIEKLTPACLKVTLDPSVAAGLKLRIRYHSGGTPFGQTPILVMNNTDNAIFRLPSNTNVLLELLDATNAVFGNLVVEDPAGTATVNNVINTGPQIPAGHTFFPGPPFTDCHPVLLRLGLPQVELRINELLADAAPRDNPTDDYVTWAPTFCRARLSTPMMSSVNIELTNDPPGQFPDGGDVLFAADQAPWPVNTTATASTLPLTLPADGSWVSFVIAGKFGKPSTDDKDAIIEAHLNNSGGAVIGTKALMVRVRKNGNNLKPSERSRYLFAWRNFRNQLGANYVRFQEMHRLASTVNDQGHMQPAFLPWHRAMLLDVERELQKIDPSVALHYWNWDFAAPNVFSQDFIGASAGGGFGTAEPVFAATNPLLGWNTDLPFSSGELRRNTDDHTLAPAPGYFKPLDHPVDPDLIGQVNYGPRVIFGGGSFSDDVEELSHNPAHGWPCGGGHVAFPVRSAADPLFYLLHSQIERQWAYWQWKNNRFGTIVASMLTFPAPAHYDNNGHFDDPGVSAWRKGSFLEDGMWPWDGTSGGPAGRAQRPVNQAPGPGSNIPASMPAIPMTPFPASLHKNLWPAAAAIPHPRNMIDYMGRFLPQDGLGFCYDDVPYN
ncbi:MAG TPA: tyrosinase family protein [Chthoniobacterales bacterium]|nr:tyrosinase family protein [Chthoniobacterales bacterium]